MKAMAMSACQFTFYEAAMFVLVVAREPDSTDDDNELSTMAQNLKASQQQGPAIPMNESSTSEKLAQKQR